MNQTSANLPVQPTGLTKEHERLHTGEALAMPPLPEALTFDQAITRLEKLKQVPTTTLFVTRADWQLLSATEVTQRISPLLTPPQQAELATAMAQPRMPLLSEPLQQIVNQELVGRCEIGIHKDSQNPHREQLYFHRILVDLSNYQAVPEGIETRFLTFMKESFGVEPLRGVTVLRNQAQLQVRLHDFPPATIKLSLN